MYSLLTDHMVLRLVRKWLIKSNLRDCCGLIRSQFTKYFQKQDHEIQIKHVSSYPDVDQNVSIINPGLNKKNNCDINLNVANLPSGMDLLIVTCVRTFVQQIVFTNQTLLLRHRDLKHKDQKELPPS